MLESRQKSYVINIEVELRDGGFFTLNTWDLPGLCLIGKDPIRMMKQVPELVKKLFKLNFGADVLVIPVSKAVLPKHRIEDLGQVKTWTAIEGAIV